MARWGAVTPTARTMTVRAAVGGADREPDDREPVRPEDIEEYDRRRAEETERWRKEYEQLLRRRGRHGHAPGEGGEEPQDGHDDPDVPPVSPFLLIRHALTDIGARPIPSGTNFWMSPDIWVQSSDPSGNPVAGEENTIVARVFNLGAFQAQPVQVDFYWGDPSVGLSPGMMNHIGTAWVDVPSLTSVDVPCPTPWVPVMVNNGHECAMVNCSNWLLDPIIAPFNPVADRHVGQRNLHVVAGAAATSSEFVLKINNVLPFRIAGTIEAEIHWLTMTDKLEPALIGAAAASFTSMETLRPQAMMKTYPRGTLAHRMAVAAARRERRYGVEPQAAFALGDDRPGAFRIHAALTGEGGAIEGGPDGEFAGRMIDDASKVVRNQRAGRVEHLTDYELEKSSFETLAVTIEAPPDLGSLDVVVVDIVQRAGDLTFGGYTIVFAPPISDSRRNGAHMTASDKSSRDLRDLVIDEVDDARDIYDLARQLAEYLPIESFEALVKATEGRMLKFRDAEFDVVSLEGLVPSIVFPVLSERALVERLGEMVRVAPAHLGVDIDSEGGARRLLRARGQIAPGIGLPSRQATATLAMRAPTEPIADPRDQPK